MKLLLTMASNQSIYCKALSNEMEIMAKSFIKNFDWIKDPARRKQAEEAHQLFVKYANNIEKGHIFAHRYHDLLDEISIEQAAPEDLSSTNIDYQDPREYPDWG